MMSKILFISGISMCDNKHIQFIQIKTNKNKTHNLLSFMNKKFKNLVKSNNSELIYYVVTATVKLIIWER